MKTMKLKYVIASFAFAAALAGCQEAAEYTPSIYITEAQKEPAKIVTIYNAGEKAEFSVSASKIVDKDTHVTVQVCPELLEEYNTTYGRTCVLLDGDLYDFAKKEVTIKAGTNVSDAGEIVVKEVLEPGTFYCLPLRITQTDGNMPVLAPSSTLYIVFRAPVHGKGVYIGSGNKYIVPGFYDQKGQDVERDLSALPELTLECRVYANDFTKSDPYISSIMGLEGNVCMRFGDVKIGYDVLQICKGDYQPAAINSPCATKQWYHVAGVWTRNSLRVFIDGKFITETRTKGETVDISQVQLWNGSGIGFGLGCASNYNGNRPLNGYLAEARVWTRALSTSEIANVKDLVIVDPNSPDLLAYWKMDESELVSDYRESYSRWNLRNKIVDQTGHGYDAYGLSASPQFLDATW